MTHQQMFKKFNNDDGYISVIVLRERYFDDMKADGWVETEAEALAQKEPIAVAPKRGHKA